MISVGSAHQTHPVRIFFSTISHGQHSVTDRLIRVLSTLRQVLKVNDLASLKHAMAAIFAKHAACAIAVKSQHAYNRTLNWIERSDAEASTALNAVLTKPAAEVDEATQLCLGDWCWARGVELTIEHNLPFKIHTGYYAGNDRMPVRRILPAICVPSSLGISMPSLY